MIHSGDGGADVTSSIDVSVITVAYNTAAVIDGAIDSVLAQRDVRAEMIIVDNASRDDGRAVLEARGDAVQAIFSPDNLGFGRANNLGFEKASGRHVLLLNPDAALVGDHALADMTAVLDANTNLGVLGPKLLNPDGTLQAEPRMGYPGQRHARDFDTDLPGEIAWLVGACLLIRSSVYAAIDGFDDDFFLYGEETDFCLRVRRAGHALAYLPDVTVEHIDAVSERGRPPYDVWMQKQGSLHLFYEKAYGVRDAQRLVRREHKRARLRLTTLAARALVLGDDEAKRAKYQAMRDAATRWLDEHR